MSAGPCNPKDFERFKALAELLSTKTPASDLVIHCHQCGNGEFYVQVELRGRLPITAVNTVFEVLK